MRGELVEHNMWSFVDMQYASNLEEAKELINTRFFDIAFIDLMFSENDDQPLGLNVIEKIRSDAPGCIKVLATSFARTNYSEVIKSVTSSVGGKTFLLNKLDNMTDQYATFISRFFSSRLKPAWELSVQESVLTALERNRPGIPTLRPDREAISAELHSILFDLFDEMATVPLGSKKVQIDVALLETQGLTSSVATRARAFYGLDAGGTEIFGNRCVVKIGPRTTITAEATRFNRFVKLGVPNDFRVELLNWTSGDALAAICYSFAGGSASDQITSMDDLVDGESTVVRAEQVLGQLFGRESNSWYLVAGPELSLRGWYEKTFETRFADRVDHVWKFLRRELAWQFDEGARRVDFGGVSYPVISHEDVGRQMFSARGHSCLVHGDLHGGNVLIDSTGRVTLIDYATVGFGPRFADAAAMAATFRLVPLKSQSGTDDELRRAGRAHSTEVGLLRGAVPNQRNGHLPSWAQLTMTLDHEILSAFSSFDAQGDFESLLSEYRRTLLIYSLSIFGLAHWNRVQRIRIIAWMSALRTSLGGQ